MEELINKMAEALALEKLKHIKPTWDKLAKAALAAIQEDYVLARKEAVDKIRITKGVKYLYSGSEIKNLDGGIFILEDETGVRTKQIADLLEKATNKKFIVQNANVCRTKGQHEGWTQY